MSTLRTSLPISKEYDSPIFDALKLQVAVGLFSLLILDGGGIAQIFGIALLAFWGGVATLILRKPHSPSKVDIWLIRFGYLLVLVIAFFLTGGIWRLRGVI